MNKKKKSKKPVCMICGKKLSSIFDMDIDPDFLNIDGGVTLKIQMPYGSRLDGNVYLAAVCDECIGKCQKEKKIRLVEEGVIF